MKAIRELVDSNPGQCCEEEYTTIVEVLDRKSPCNLLIFGVGRDSQLWLDVNAGGKTVFVEDNPDWIQMARAAIPTANIIQVSYTTRRRQWKRLLKRGDLLFMTDLPNEILATKWDVIFVDTPAGNKPGLPGRMKSIYTASVLAFRGVDTDVFVHDCDRQVEQVYCDTFFGDPLLIKKVLKLRHYCARPTVLRLEASNAKGH